VTAVATTPIPNNLIQSILPVAFGNKSFIKNVKIGMTIRANTTLLNMSKNANSAALKILSAPITSPQKIMVVVKLQNKFFFVPKSD
ncbi:MAG TPA: hypothetical protein VE467_04930, partial [Chryseolinea sp.]|nr:hypothetical protein [Chryseolinea sp.]